jgi:hypothetical protein
MKSFLSYPSEQRSVARALYDFLCSIGIQPWFDQESLIGGQDWDRERKIAQRAVDLTFLVLSPETISRSGVIQREVKEILDLLETRPLGHTFLVSLRTRDISVPPELGRYQYIDFFRSGWEAKIGRAVRLKLQELRESEPPTLTAFLAAQESAQGVQFKALRFHTQAAEAQADYFVYQQSGEYWEYINAEIVADIVGGFLAAKYAEIRGDVPAPNYWVRRVEEHFRQGELVSLRIDASQYFGGAYPNHGVYTMNFGGADVGKVGIRELFGYDTDVRRLIFDHCNRAYRGRGGDDNEVTLREDDSYSDAWQKISQWSFSEAGLLISLSEWSDLPHVLGINEALIPWGEVKAKVAARYRPTPLGQFIASR